MPEINFKNVDGSITAVEVAVSTSIMQAAISSGVEGIVAECGGNALCATCHVYVDPSLLDVLPPLSEDEDEMLECAASPREANSRLSCQVPITADLHGMHVTIPKSQV
ncbi:MAG: thcC 2 [Mycobacterium sp.]|nr:thcC 2 [Mycobacterium sp.]